MSTTKIKKLQATSSPKGTELIHPHSVSHHISNDEADDQLFNFKTFIDPDAYVEHEDKRNVNCNITNNVGQQATFPKILQRRSSKDKLDLSTEYSKILYPKLPYHKRWENYMAKRNEIFQDSCIDQLSTKRTKRSTLRLRKFNKTRIFCSKILISAILNNPNDQRYYAKISFLNYTEYGLLDTGASISCIGSDFAKENFSKYKNFSKCTSSVKTADGKSQKVIGWLNVEIKFKDKVCSLNLFIIPTISQRLILGIDFWRAFDLIPSLIVSVDLVDRPLLNLQPLEAGKGLENTVVKEEFDCEDNKYYYPLNEDQKQQLRAVISLFPNFEKQGLGRTSLIAHDIEVGETKPIKQHFDPVSPAVENRAFEFGLELTYAYGHKTKQSQTLFGCPKS